MALDVDRTIFGDVGRQLVLVAHSLHQRRRAPVDKALRQPLMQCVRQLVLDLARAGLPMGRVLEPVGAIGYERPSANVCQPVRQRIDIAVRAIRECHLLGKPILVDPLVARAQRLVQRSNQLGMIGRRNLAIIRQLANIPQQLDRSPAVGKARKLWLTGDCLEGRHIVGHPRPRKTRHLWNIAQALAQAEQRRKIHIAVTPLQRADRLKIVRLKPLDEIGIHGIGAAGDTEAAIVHVTARAARNLRDFPRRQITMVLPIELAQRR